MCPLLDKALQAITDRTNLATGLTHQNDKNAAKELFLRLHQADEPLNADEIRTWAATHGWRGGDAKELGELAARIGSGRRPQISDGPWWGENIIEQLGRTD